MRVYIDFDDVICETAKHFCCIAKELFDIDLPYQEVQFFNLKKSFDLDDDQYEELMKAGHLPIFPRLCWPMKKRQVLLKLSTNGWTKGMRFPLLPGDRSIRMAHPEDGWMNTVWSACLCIVSTNTDVNSLPRTSHSA